MFRGAPDCQHQVLAISMWVVDGFLFLYSSLSTDVTLTLLPFSASVLFVTFVTIQGLERI